MSKFNDIKNEALKDPKVKAVYDALEPEYDKIKKRISSKLLPYTERICKICNVNKCFDSRVGHKCRECFNKIAIERYRKNPEHYKAKHRAWRKSPRGLATQKARTKRENAKLKIDAFTSYGGAICVCCRVTELDFLTLDHINNDGAAHRKSIPHMNFYRWLKQNNYPDIALQVMCMNCNFSKQLSGECVHKSSNL